MASSIDPNSKRARRQAADSLSRNPLRVAWTSHDGAELTHGGERIAVSAEEWRRFVRGLLRGEFAVAPDRQTYATPENPSAPGKANVAGMPTDREIAPAVVRALGSAASPGDIAMAAAVETATPVAAQPPTPVEQPITTTGCVR